MDNSLSIIIYLYLTGDAIRIHIKRYNYPQNICYFIVRGYTQNVSTCNSDRNLSSRFSFGGGGCVIYWSNEIFQHDTANPFQDTGRKLIV